MIPQEIALRINNRAQQMGTNVAKVLDSCKLPRSTVDNMKNGSQPSADKIVLIARELKTTTDFILGETDNPLPLGEKIKLTTEDELSQIKKDLIDFVTTLTDEQTERVRDLVQTALRLGEK